MISEPGTTVSEADVRAAVYAELSSSWGPEVAVSLNEAGSVFLKMDETPVLCRFSTLGTGHVIVEVEAPVLLDFVPPSDFYEMISIQQIRLDFGVLLVGAGEGTDQIMLLLSAKIFADGLDAIHLKRAILLVHRAALEQIRILENLAPPLGGYRAYG